MTYITYETSELIAKMDNNSNYPCPNAECTYKSPFKFALAHHITKKHNQETVTDDTESREFDCTANLEMYKCLRCPSEMFLKINLIKHASSNDHEEILLDFIDEVEEEPDEYPCPRCRFLTCSLCVWKRHKAKCKKRRRRRKKLKTKEALIETSVIVVDDDDDTQQQQDVIETEVCHKCELCSYMSPRLSSKLRHMLTSHPTQCVCKICKKVVPPSHMYKHQLTHNQDNFDCTKCTFTCKDQLLLQKHVFTKHAKGDERVMKLYKCEWCSYKTPHLRKITQHYVRWKHGNKDAI